MVSSGSSSKAMVISRARTPCCVPMSTRIANELLSLYGRTPSPPPRTPLHLLDRLTIPTDAQAFAAWLQHDRDVFVAAFDVTASLQIEGLVHFVVRCDGAVRIEPAHRQRLDQKRRFRPRKRLAVACKGSKCPATVRRLGGGNARR